MHTLPLSFALLTYTGYWRPITWTVNSLKYRLYNVYSAVMILLLNTFAIWGLIAALMSEDLDTLLDKLSLFVSVFAACCKVANLFVRRDKIISVADILLKKSCIPMDEEEQIIQQRFDRFARKLTIYCEILNEATVFFATLAPFKQFLKTRTLPVANWAPYDCSPIVIYMLSFLHQSSGLMVCANASVAHDSLISGLMIQACAQMEILCHRVRILPALILDARKSSKSKEDLESKQRTLVRNVIQHHLEVYDFALTVNDVFNLMLFVQFSISSIVLCLSVYRMSRIELLTVDFAWNLTYLLSMLMQVYLYCWFGNDVTLKSIEISNAVYEMDWTTLPVNILKDLHLIMTRCTRPIRMSSGHVVILSAESFMSIIKLSYSAYNLLKDSSVK